MEAGPGGVKRTWGYLPRAHLALSCSRLRYSGYFLGSCALDVAYRGLTRFEHNPFGLFNPLGRGVA